MRILLAKTAASLAQASGKYLTVIMLEALCLHPHPAFETWCSNNRTLEFILTRQRETKAKCIYQIRKPLACEHSLMCIIKRKKKKRSHSSISNFRVQSSIMNSIYFWREMTENSQFHYLETSCSCLQISRWFFKTLFFSF